MTDENNPQQTPPETEKPKKHSSLMDKLKRERNSLNREKSKKGNFGPGNKGNTNATPRKIHVRPPTRGR
jgi:hypothetical protein